MKNLVGQFVTVWLRPWAAMNQIKETAEMPGNGSSMAFVAVMGLLTGIITVVAGLVAPTALAESKEALYLSIVIIPVVSFLGSFIGALIIWGLVDGWLRGTAKQYWISYRLLALLAAFSPVAAALSAIPKVGQYLAIAVNVWATIVMIRGIIITRNTPTVRTWVTCGLLFALLFALGIAAQFATRQQLNAGAGYPEYGATDFGGTDDLTDEELDKQLQDLATKAQSQPNQSKK